MTRISRLPMTVFACAIAIVICASPMTVPQAHAVSDLQAGDAQALSAQASGDGVYLREGELVWTGEKTILPKGTYSRTKVNFTTDEHMTWLYFDTTSAYPKLVHHLEETAYPPGTELTEMAQYYDVTDKLFQEQNLHHLYNPDTGKYKWIVNDDTAADMLASGWVDIDTDWLASVYRLYNPNSGEHHYTLSSDERDFLVDAGWNDEQIGWQERRELGGSPVYRLYNPNAGEHHYTLDASERDHLVDVGWNDEGVGWGSADASGEPVYREYNPNAYANNHNYTTSKAEHDYLISLGWRDEGVAWYGLKDYEHEHEFEHSISGPMRHLVDSSDWTQDVCEMVAVATCDECGYEAWGDVMDETYVEATGHAYPADLAKIDERYEEFFLELHPDYLNPHVMYGDIEAHMREAHGKQSGYTLVEHPVLTGIVFHVAGETTSPCVYEQNMCTICDWEA